MKTIPERFKFWLRTRWAKHWDCSRCCLFCKWFPMCVEEFETQFSGFAGAEDLFVLQENSPAPGRGAGFILPFSF